MSGLIFKIGLTACVVGIIGVKVIRSRVFEGGEIETFFGAITLLSLITAPVCLVAYIWVG